MNWKKESKIKNSKAAYLDKCWRKYCWFQRESRDDSEIFAILEKIQKEEFVTDREQSDLVDYFKRIIRASYKFNKKNATTIGRDLEDLQADLLVYMWEKIPLYKREKGNIWGYFLITVNTWIDYEIRKSIILTGKIPKHLLVSLSDEISQSLEDGDPITYEELVQDNALIAEEAEALKGNLKLLKDKVHAKDEDAGMIYDLTMEGRYGIRDVAVAYARSKGLKYSPEILDEVKKKINDVILPAVEEVFSS